MLLGERGRKPRPCDRARRRRGRAGQADHRPLQLRQVRRRLSRPLQDRPRWRAPATPADRPSSRAAPTTTRDGAHPHGGVSRQDGADPAVLRGAGARSAGRRHGGIDDVAAQIDAALDGAVARRSPGSRSGRADGCRPQDVLQRTSRAISGRARVEHARVPVDVRDHFGEFESLGERQEQGEDVRAADDRDALVQASRSASATS